ncbi:glycosyltransferase family 4 protein [Sphingopyxis sp.]|uniref:glycosyltransferase family 4 protein n=1 Tax=Sphingopyxis sp. TaxID=1908224 RepID=UPI003D103186
MKILVFSSLAYSLVNFRGALLTRLIDEGHEVVAVAPDQDFEVSAWLKSRQIRLTTVAMDRAGVMPLQDLKTLWGYIRLIAVEKPDLILAYTQKPIIYGGIAARIMGNVPFFVLMSGLGYLFSPDGAKPGLTRSIFLRLYREGVRRARKIFVFNKDDRADMLAAGIITPRHDVIRVPGSGVDTRHFQQQPLPEKGLHFLMVGRLMRDKGVFEFLEAARRINAENPEVAFSILGRSETSNPTGLSGEDVARLQQEYPVDFLRETTDVRPHLAQASVFVLPSYYREGLPRTILEAMATGRAVITTDMPGCRDPIEDGINGLIVPPRDIDALTAAMRSFIAEKGRAAAMGGNARKIAERDYDVAKVNATLIAHMGLDGDRPVQKDASSADLRIQPAMAVDNL